MKDVVVVWRAAEGAAVQTYAHPDKTPRLFSDASAPELAGVVSTSKVELVSLLESHLPFDKRKVDARTAASELGWDV